MSANAYAWHTEALRHLDAKGRLRRDAGLPIYEASPECGTYRMPDGAGSWRYVCIYWDSEEIRATVDFCPVDARSIWTWVCKYPVPIEEYEQWEQGLRGRASWAAAKTPGHRGAADILPLIMMEKE